MLTAVRAANHAADFDGAVQHVGVGHAAGDHQDPLGRVGARRHGDFREADADGHRLPGVATVLAAVNLAVLVSGVHQIGVVWMKEQRPDGQAMIRHVDFLPVIAVIGTPVGTCLRAHIHGFRLLRVNGNGPDSRRLGQPVAQGFPRTIARGSAIQAGLNDSAWGGFTGQAGIHIGPLV